MIDVLNQYFWVRHFSLVWYSGMFAWIGFMCMYLCSGSLGELPRREDFLIYWRDTVCVGICFIESFLRPARCFFSLYISSFLLSSLEFNFLEFLIVFIAFVCTSGSWVVFVLFSLGEWKSIMNYLLGMHLQEKITNKYYWVQNSSVKNNLPYIKMNK